jgi:hypothetical protein
VGQQTNCADEGKPWCIDPSVLNCYAVISVWLCIYIQELKWNPGCMVPRYLCPLLVW